jgi:hypothetical protein
MARPDVSIACNHQQVAKIYGTVFDIRGLIMKQNETTARKGDFKLATSLAALVLAGLAAPAMAQPATAGAEESKEDATIIVTGTRRTDRTVAESAVPIDVFSADDFKAQPSPQLQNILKTLVPSFNQNRNLLGDASAFVRPPNLRGLPADQILVLVNGKRVNIASYRVKAGDVISVRERSRNMALVIEALQSAGVIECLDRATGRLYGYRSDPHSHLTCSESGAILDLDIHLPADLIAGIEALTGFEIESYTLQLTGRRR